jgi:acetyl/propionyl-CoA carboxylase alpha subunit
MRRAISPLLVANRGEIAVRVTRACEKPSIERAAVVSAADCESLAARLATRTVCTGPPPAAQSYPTAEALVTTARATGRDAMHPGYRFRRIAAALDGLEAAGDPTTAPCHSHVMAHHDFRSAAVTTRWVEEKVLKRYR